jgi:LPS sulfotransferase NodH
VKLDENHPVQLALAHFRPPRRNLFGAVLVALILPAQLPAQFGGIVFDPTSWGELVRQYVAQLQEYVRQGLQLEQEIQTAENSDALMRPLAYIVCTSPRTGSTLLCQGLSHSGRAGAPAEFFDHRTEVEEYWRRHYGIDRESDYVSGIIVATSTSNGVFGTKLHWSTLLDMYRALRGSPASPSPARQGGSLNDLLLQRFSTVRYVWLRRRNKIAQGISHFKASRTSVWELPAALQPHPMGQPTSVDFDLRLIDKCVEWAHIYDNEWEAYFQRRHITPMHFADPRFPRFAKLLDALERLVATNPKVTFIGAHVGGNAEHLAWVARLLNAYPNFYVDVAARLADLGRQPRATRRLVLAYPRRVLFGTDASPPASDAYSRHFRFFETDDECFSGTGTSSPGSVRWTISGIDLPAEVLADVYRGNARRIIPVLRTT